LAVTMPILMNIDYRKEGPSRHQPGSKFPDMLWWIYPVLPIRTEKYWYFPCFSNVDTVSSKDSSRLSRTPYLRVSRISIWKWTSETDTTVALDSVDFIDRVFTQRKYAVPDARWSTPPVLQFVPVKWCRQ
jgi:hypothetical protein